MNHQNQQVEVQVKASDEKLKGDYANVMQVLHTKEEVVLDFLNVFPPTGTLNARIIVSPGHFKRMIQAMQGALKKYEDVYGSIEAAEAPTSSIGFEAKN